MKYLITLNNENHAVTERPKEYLLDVLLKKKEQNGKYPSITDVMKDPDMPTQGTYAYFFKTYENALVEADFYERRKQGIKPEAKVKAEYIGLAAK